MGNTSNPTHEYNVDAQVHARYDGNQTIYYPATIIKKHDYGRYDVKFQHNGQILTVFWNDIQSYSAPIPIQEDLCCNCDSKSISSINGDFQILKENELNQQLQKNINDGIYHEKDTKIFNISLNSDDNNINFSDDEWSDFTQNFDSYLQNKQVIKFQLTPKHCNKSSNSFDIKQLKKFENLMNIIGGPSLCKNIILSHQDKASEHIMTSIQNATAHNNDIKYIKKLKSLEVLPSNKHGLRYKFVLDLDYDELLIKNKDFDTKLVNEIASILKLHRSLINIESTQRGSIIVTVCIIGAGLIFILFCVWSIKKLVFFICKTKKKNALKQKESNKGESLTDLNPGDEVFVEYHNKTYDATVLEKYQNINKSWIKIGYVNKPFTFKNTEKLQLNSSRLHIKEPGYQYQATLYPDEGGKISFEIIPIVSH